MAFIKIQKLKWLKEENFPTILTKTVRTPGEVIDIRYYKTLGFL
ncbi:MAG: hypothetical protein ACXAB8_10090 [Promethearchaeota archaeon]|jgi:hypothetical protein